MGKKNKESYRRSKLKEQRILRLKSIKKEKKKQQNNSEFYKIYTQENIDKLTTKEKLELMGQLYNLLISYPETNSDKLSLMLLFLKDNSITIILKSAEYLKNIFMESIPLYRINEYQNNTKESKEIKKMKSQEKNILINYGQYIDDIKILDQSFNNKKECLNLRQKFCEFLSELFEKFYYFNYENKLYSYLADKLSDYDLDIKKRAFISLYNVLSKVDNSKNMFELKFNIIKKIIAVINNKNHKRFDSNVMDLFTAHRMIFPDYVKENENLKNKIDLSDLKYGGPSADTSKTKQEYIKAQKNIKEFNREKNKIIKSMIKDMNEIEKKDDSKMIYFMNLKILKKILLLFFEILKDYKDSELIGGVFNGISTLCENINVEILLDLQKCIYETIKYLIKNNKLSLALLGLKSNLSIARKMTKEIVSIEDSYLITSSYQIICYYINNLNYELKKDDIYIIFEVIEIILLKNRMYSIDTSAAFVKRLSMLCKNNNNENYVIAFLLLIKRILSKYPDLNFLIDINESDFDNFDYKNILEPSLCNGKLTNILNELNFVQNKFKSNKNIIKLVEYIIKGTKANAELNSLNYYDFLLK
jgi:hypothetical protein